MKKLHIDWQVKVIPAFGESREREGHDYPNLGICEGLLAQILILLQTPFVRLIINQIHDRRQLINWGSYPKLFIGFYCKH